MFKFVKNQSENNFRWISAILILIWSNPQILKIRTPGYTTLICVKIYCDFDIFTAIFILLKSQIYWNLPFFFRLLKVTEIISVNWNYWNWNFLPSFSTQDFPRNFPEFYGKRTGQNQYNQNNITEIFKLKNSGNSQPMSLTLTLKLPT